MIPVNAMWLCRWTFSLCCLHISIRRHIMFTYLYRRILMSRDGIFQNKICHIFLSSIPKRVRYSLEPPHRGGSEYSNFRFQTKNERKIIYTTVKPFSPISSRFCSLHVLVNIYKAFHFKFILSSDRGRGCWRYCFRSNRRLRRRWRKRRRWLRRNFFFTFFSARYLQEINERILSKLGYTHHYGDLF